MSLTYHDYREDSLIAVDIETKDPFLIQKGPGVYRKDGYVVGVSFANADIEEYYPIHHPDTSSEEEEKNRRYISEQLLANNAKAFANCMYDLDWLINYERMTVGGTYEDVQVAEPLLDENRRSYSLNSLADSYLGSSKSPEKMIEYAKALGWPLTKKEGATQHLWRMPYGVVREYAADDARLTYDILELQKRELASQSLLGLYHMEMSLFPLLLQMRKVGVRVDGERLTSTGIELSDIAYDLQEDMDSLTGSSINVNSGKDLEKLFLQKNIPVRYSEPTDNMLSQGKTRGNPSFDKKVLGRLDHPVAKKILELRHIKTLLSMYIHPYPDLMVDGRLHGQFHPLRNDDYGTVSGRFSSSNPNLQQVSGKIEEGHVHVDSEILNGLIVRKLFIPEEDHDWLKMDWSQIEYRLIAHYASGAGAETIRKRYNEDPNVDYHKEMSDMTGLPDRKVVKTLNFGAAYGMGWKKMAYTYGWNEREAKEVYDMYHSKVPFVKETSKKVALRAKKIGYIRTLLNRRSRLVSSGKAYVKFNSLIQGSAADIMKKAMVMAFEEGVFNTLVPHLTVHDEMDCSMPKTQEGIEAGKHLKHIMENCVELRVPIKADCEIGRSWGELEEWET